MDVCGRGHVVPARSYSKEAAVTRSERCSLPSLSTGSIVLCLVRTLSLPAAAPAASCPASGKQKAATGPHAAGEQEAGQAGPRPPGTRQDHRHKAPGVRVPRPRPVTPSAALRCGRAGPISRKRRQEPRAQGAGRRAGTSPRLWAVPRGWGWLVLQSVCRKTTELVLS